VKKGKVKQQEQRKSLRKDQRGFTGLEAAIVLTAFVVVAAVFSYVVLNAGFFTTQKSKEVIHTGITQATSSAELTGSIIGYSMTESDGVLTNATTGGSRLNATRFYLQLTAGQSPMAMEGVTISYSDEDTHVGNVTYNASAGGAEINTSTSSLGLRPGEWNYTIIVPTGFGDTDKLLELGEIAQITVALPDGGVAADKDFIMEVKPAQGASISIERTAPSAIDAVMDLT
jgi:flagellin FlaB